MPMSEIRIFEISHVIEIWSLKVMGGYYGGYEYYGMWEYENEQNANPEG